MTRVRREAGSSLLEFVVAGTVIAVVVGVLLDRLWVLEERAEKLVVELTLRNMRTGMQLQQAAMMTGGREAEIGALLRTNPVEWLQHPPAGYVGEVERIDAERLPPGAWVFAREENRLYYRPRLDGHLVIEGKARLLAWRVGRPGERGASLPGALKIEALTLYSWEP